MTPKYTITQLQIQPQWNSRLEWRSLAAKEGFTYEVLELSAPPALNNPALYQSCKDWYHKSGRVTSVHGVFIDVNPGSGDAAFRKLSRARHTQSCRLAASLGAKNVVFHSSCFPFLRGGYLDFWAGECAGFYEELADTWNLNIFIENSPDVDAGPIAELMRRITDRRVGVCLDLGHVNYSRMSMEQWFDALFDRIGYLHLSDNDGSYDSHLPLGKGSVNWELANRLWEQLARNIPVTLETGSVKDTVQSLIYLKKHQYFRTFGGNV